jgi:hypothetical protein
MNNYRSNSKAHCQPRHPSLMGHPNASSVKLKRHPFWLLRRLIKAINSWLLLLLESVLLLSLAGLVGIVLYVALFWWPGG